MHGLQHTMMSLIKGRFRAYPGLQPVGARSRIALERIHSALLPDLAGLL